MEPSFGFPFATSPLPNPHQEWSDICANLTPATSHSTRTATIVESNAGTWFKVTVDGRNAKHA